MPNRLIREEMLESESILSLPVEARWLYVTILLSADDIGLFEATVFKLARKADIRRESGEKLLAMLADADLIRLYEVDGKRFGFIPKFRQRLQIKRSKHPHPPMALLDGDPDAINKINDLASKTTVGQQMDTDGQQMPTGVQPPEPEPEPEEEPKKNIRNTGAKAPRASVSCPQDVDKKVWEDWLAIRKAKRLPLTETAWEELMVERAKAGLTTEKMIRECCLRGWAAFKASWWAKEQVGQNVGERNAAVLQGLTRGLVGGDKNVKLLGK